MPICEGVHQIHAWDLTYAWIRSVCYFVMGFLTWAKCKLEENWPTSLSEAITKMEGFSDVGWGEKFGFKKKNKFHHKKACHEGEWSWRQDVSKGEKPKKFQGLGFKPKCNFVKKGFLWKRTNPKGMLPGSPKETVSITMKWDITPKIDPNPNQAMGVLK